MTSNAAVITYLRHRRATYFFTGRGPELPAGASARWRITPGEPQGWHANMIGFVDAPNALLGQVLDIATNWFAQSSVDAWVDADEWSALYPRQDLIIDRGYTLHDDWHAMLCRTVPQIALNPRVEVREARNRADLLNAAWIAVQHTRPLPVPLNAPLVLRRLESYVHEQQVWNTRYVTAAINGTPVGVARLTDEDVPVIVGVGTLASARCRGVATAITAFLATEAIRTYGVCALYSDRESQAARIYARLGFRPLYHMRVWHRPHQQQIKSPSPAAAGEGLG